MLPQAFTEIVPLSFQQRVENWWNELPEETKSEMQSFYEAGDEGISRIIGNVNDELYRRSIELEAEELETLDFLEFPNQDYYENLIGNEVYLCLRGPTFHVCKAHPKLRLHLLLGVLPAKDGCFIGKKSCKMSVNLSQSKGEFWKLRISQTQDRTRVGTSGHFVA